MAWNIVKNTSTYNIMRLRVNSKMKHVIFDDTDQHKKLCTQFKVVLHR